MNKVADVVFNFFKLCNLKPVQIRKGIYQVQIPDALAKELDGWRAKGGLFQFTFDQKLAETYGAELISEGGYRLDSIIKVIQKQARLSNAILPHTTFFEPTIRRKILDRLAKENPGYRWYIVDYHCKYSPYFLFVLQLTYLAYEKQEEIRKPLVDLITGRVLTFEIPLDLLVEGEIEKSMLLKRRISYQQAYQQIQLEINEQLQYSDATWAKQATEIMQTERERLENFFKDLPDDEQKERRIAELMERAKPRVQIRPLRGVLLYFPKFLYRVIQVGSKEKTNRISYDPVSNHLEYLV